MSDLGLRVTMDEIAAGIPTPDGKRFRRAFARGTLEVELYAPRGADPQQPHDRDELYVVAKGSGTFVCGEERMPFGPHDVLFAPAGLAHRFEGFGDDFFVWVMVYGPEGGEKAEVER
jgi:mannose-6-phosphate isomerase-like protein (cupin superfamily)